jgi:hypothetical protein
VPPRFALDHNFPQPVVGALGYIREAKLVALKEVDERLTRDCEDWQILLALRQLGDFDGFITLDSAMAWLPKELAVLRQTRLTLVVLERVGHDPILATGLLLIHLGHVARQTVRRVGQLWILRPPGRTSHITPLQQLESIASKSGETAMSLYQKVKLTRLELIQPVLT